MQILSENIKRYIINNLSLKDEENFDISDIYKIEEINLNRVNYKLKEANFIPEEISYFKNLRKCSFNGFLINDDIKKNLSKLENLEVLEFNHCIITGYFMIKNRVKQINIKHSNFEFINIIEDKTNMEKMILKNVINVDMKKISEFTNIKELNMLNCEVNNSYFINSLKRLNRIKIIGCKLDKDDIIDKIDKNVEVIYSKNKFFYSD